MMLVPRSFKYSSSPPLISPNNTSSQPHDRRAKSQRLFSGFASTDPTAATHQQPADKASRSPVTSPEPSFSMRPSSRPVEIPSSLLSRHSRERDPGPQPTRLTRTREQSASSRRSQRSDDVVYNDSLPPAVAALLAVTAIPPPKSTQFGRKKKGAASARRISIDELVQEWRNDSSLRSSFGSAPLELLLEPADESAEDLSSYSRSSSCDSIPSLDADDHSDMSVGSPATPASVHSQRSTYSSMARKEKYFSPAEPEECGLDHPLGLITTASDQDLALLALPATSPKGGRGRISSALRSNLTSSLQALKSRALSSISSFNAALNQSDATFSDATLWQHPYIFPRLSSEVRPTPFSSTPTRSQRRYFNPSPSPIPFEEQQYHWRRALCTTSGDPSMDGEDLGAPMIQMQTYRRSSPSTRKSRRNSGTPDPRTEAGRAMAAAQAQAQQGRQREVRENSDFLRVVVLEMNMRRQGKLEETAGGRARIWLPPRKVAVTREEVFSDEEDEETGPSDGPVGRRIPRRWIGVSVAY